MRRSGLFLRLFFLLHFYALHLIFHPVCFIHHFKNCDRLHFIYLFSLLIFFSRITFQVKIFVQHLLLCNTISSRCVSFCRSHEIYHRLNCELHFSSSLSNQMSLTQKALIIFYNKKKTFHLIFCLFDFSVLAHRETIVISILVLCDAR